MSGPTRARAVLLSSVGILAACGNAFSSVEVSLRHCGVDAVTVNGRLWEAVTPQSVDSSPDLPLDGTNTPEDWVGRGTVVIAGDQMTYTDRGGEVIQFVPDDGMAPPPCAQLVRPGRG
ncbi:hypothetical protein DQ239_01080 [Blastococcus sp. TF02-09]|uniref:hypothetical protein n=1 Tax=Blastococcus sp. TF02-09 TaxID=2250576 RepID=UPI000DE87C94|nr:hypothetical protein [Blastococcus sp. TF02-9]RBY81237.1 hypothetical protein DQ239_01080 [Blastococcus sp. TF02-9]